MGVEWQGPLERLDACRVRIPRDYKAGMRADGVIYVADLDNRRVRKLTPVIAPPVVDPVYECSVVHGASFLAGPAAPGQIVSVFGSGIGPAEGAKGRFTTAGVLASSLGDTEVRFNGIPAPLFYAGDSQVNAQVPYSVLGLETVDVEVFVGGRLHSQASLEMASAVPGIFTMENGAGKAVAVNQDGTLNAPGNPAARGSIVTLYATGEGQTHPEGAGGAPAQSPLPKPVLPVQVRIGGLPVEVLYAGGAPGFVGLMQINARAPAGFVPSGALPVMLYVGGASSQPGVTISVE